MRISRILIRISGILIMMGWLSVGTAQPIAELQRAIATWNERYSEVAFCHGIADMGSLSQQNRGQIRNALIDPANVWMLTGEITHPESLVLRSAADVSHLAQSEAYVEWATRVSSLVDQSTYWFQLEFELPNGACIRSIALANDSEVLYNSIFSEAFYIERLALHCFHVKGYNILGILIAEAEANVYAICDPITGCLITCDKFCDAWVFLGVSRITCNTTAIGDCCKLEYDVELRSGIWMRIFGATFGIGSTYTANGSCTECCRYRSRIAPSPSHPRKP